MKARPTYRGAVIKPAHPSGKIVQPTASTPGAPARVRVGREVSGRAGKGVSVITGLPLSEPDLQALATKLKKLCGTGGTVKSQTIEIQGDHRDRLLLELQKLGYDAKKSGG